MKEDPNLYFSTEGPVTICTHQPICSALGEIIFAGTKWNSQATYGHAPAPDFMRRTPHDLLFYTLEGEADYRDSTGIQTILTKGSLVWARKNVNQSYGPRPGKKWSEFFMWFRGPLFDAWQAQGFPGKTSLVLTLEPVDYWLDRLRRIVAPEGSARSESDLVRLCRVQSLLAEALQAHAKGGHDVKDAQWHAEACRRLLESNLPLPAIAESMNMSYSLFRQRFLALCGKSPGKFRSDEAIRCACELLVQTDKSIGAIAAQIGFEDPLHFSRRFKAKTGLSPVSFRKQVRT